VSRHADAVSLATGAAAGRFSAMAAVDVTDATFESEVMQRSKDVPVVVDLWAPWCGPCRTLGPIIEKVIDETDGKVALVKVNVDENPQISQAFGVQSIPLVVAVKDGQPVDGFLGAHPESTVRQFVERLLPTAEEETLARLLAAGDEESLRQALELAPGDEDVVVALAQVLVERGQSDEALALLARVPETERVRHVAALARVGEKPSDDYDAKLTSLLERVREDESARQEYVDILELMGPDDPRTAAYRRQLTSRLF
jgi:putative thioredoxin